MGMSRAQWQHDGLRLSQETTAPGEQPIALHLPEQLLETLAQRVAMLLRPHLQAQADAASPWLDFEAARRYLGFSRDRLYKLSAARAIPCRKQVDGQRLLFHRAELDAWLESEYPRLDRLP
jgi:excisionase family DNA binding protein